MMSTFTLLSSEALDCELGRAGLAAAAALAPALFEQALVDEQVVFGHAPAAEASIEGAAYGFTRGLDQPARGGNRLRHVVHQNSGHAIVAYFGHRALPEREHGRSARHGFDGN